MDWSFYGIVDRESLGARTPATVAEALIRGGAGILQYRNKKPAEGEFLRDAAILRGITEAHGIPFIVNDRADVALSVRADGIHLGGDDMPVSSARVRLGVGRWIGFSVRRLSELEAAGSADYLGVGAIFPTATKSDAEPRGLDLVRSVRACTHLPLIGIGGITLRNVASVIEAGCDGVAVISAVLHAEDMEGTVKRFVEAIRHARAAKSPGQSIRRTQPC